MNIELDDNKPSTNDDDDDDDEEAAELAALKKALSEMDFSNIKPMQVLRNTHTHSQHLSMDIL